jgi:F0F1-type ATP synthase membrane subunit b/b'
MSEMELPNLTDPVFIAKVIDFVIFVAAIAWLFNWKLKAALVTHQEAQNRIVEDAQAYREKCEASVTDANAAVERALADAARMIEVGKAQAARLVDEERAAARERAARILAHAGGELERERYRVRRELLEETVELAHTRARELAKREIDGAKQRALVERLLFDLERSRA